MIKRIVAICLIAVAIVLIFSFYADGNHILHNEIANTEVSGYAGIGESTFLSDEYFHDIDSLFEQIKKENNGSKKKAAEAVINKMIFDLENNPDDLPGHANFMRFFETFDKSIRELDSITECMHFFRNTLNSYSGAPENFEDMIDLSARGKWQLFSAKFHRYNYGEINGALNVKFISADGRFETVYNTETGKMVTDPANMGTYNYAPGSINPIEYYMHNKYDKKPWKKWGNVNGLSYSDIMRLDSGHGSDEATSNEEGVKRLIQSRKNELVMDWLK